MNLFLFISSLSNPSSRSFHRHSREGGNPSQIQCSLCNGYSACAEYDEFMGMVLN